MVVMEHSNIRLKELKRCSATVRAAVISAPDTPISLVDFPEPELALGEVLVRTIYSEVCGTDVHLHHGKLEGVPYPIIPGHFAVGIAEKVNGDVLSVAGRPVNAGDMITFLDVHNTCHRCWQCQVDKTPTRCPSRKVYGVTHSSNDGLLGGWAEKLLLKSDVCIAHLPDGMTPLRFISGGCAMPTAIHAVERANINIGNIVVIQGAGPVGLCAALAAHHSGATVFVTEKSLPRLEAVKQLGFNAIDLNVTEPGTAHLQLQERTGGYKADVVIEATGSSHAIKDGCRLARDGGRYVIVGHYADSGETSINPHLDINKKHLEILGTWGVEYHHFHKALQLLAIDNITPSGVAFEGVMTKIYALSEIEDALNDVENRQVVKAVISPNSGDLRL